MVKCSRSSTFKKNEEASFLAQNNEVYVFFEENAWNMFRAKPKHEVTWLPNYFWKNIDEPKITNHIALARWNTISYK